MSGSHKPQQDAINSRIEIPYSRTKQDFENHLAIHLSAQPLLIKQTTAP